MHIIYLAVNSQSKYTIHYSLNYLHFPYTNKSTQTPGTLCN